MEEIKVKYDNILVDVVNLCYRIYKEEDPSLLSSKFVYKTFVKNFILTIEDLKNKYLHSDGNIYLLFDNYFSRVDLQNSFMYADRKRIDETYKKARKKDTKEFYNSINLIRYYYLIGPPKYYTIRIDGLEADDFVKPILQKIKSRMNLMVTTDLDWCRYLSETTHWLPDLSQPPETNIDLSHKLGFKVNETSIISYKAFFGDLSDNIPEVARKTKENFTTFCDYIKKVKSPEDFISIARDKPTNPLFKGIIDDERQFIINLQLVKNIPIQEEVFKQNLVEGRNADTLFKSLREVLGLESQKTFVFGNVKRPRV